MHPYLSLKIQYLTINEFRRMWSGLLFSPALHYIAHIVCSEAQWQPIVTACCCHYCHWINAMAECCDVQL